MKIESSIKNTHHYISQKFNTVSKADKIEYASTEEALTSAHRIMNLYDEAFRELAK